MAIYHANDLLPLAQRTGRWVVRKINNQPVLYTTNLGSSIKMVSKAAQEVQVTVLDNGSPQVASQFYAYRVDRGSWQRVAAAKGTWKIPLPDCQSHLIEVMTAGNTDLDPVWTGQAGFAIVSITSRPGALPPAPLQPLVDFIGDSITAGCWVAGRHASADYQPESNYVGIASDQLGIDSVRIAYSAGGVLRPATGGVPVASQFLPQIDQTTRWAVNQPDMVVVNIGVNDRRYPTDQFVLAYDHFISQVKSTFPNSLFLIMVTFSQTFRTEIVRCAHRHHLPVIDTRGWCTSFTDGLHPDQIGAQTAGRRLAGALTPFLKQIKGGKR